MRGLLAELFTRILAVDAATVDLVVAVRTPVLTKMMTSVTGLGSASAAAVFLGLCHLAGWDREKRVGTVAMLCSGLVVVSLMAAVQRPFPPQPVCLTDGSGVAPHSFPSGHAAAVTVYALVARDSARLPTAVVGGIALLVAVSRVYLGTHYLSDTVVGVLIGVGAYLAAEWALGRYGWPTVGR
jgi:undecaprenyl-diphosphatase